MKKEAGITMIELVVVIVIVIIIAAISISSGTETLNEADVTEVYEEMNSVKQVINSIVLKQSMDETFELDEGDEYDKKFADVLSTGIISESYYTDEILLNKDQWFVIFGRDNEEAYNESDVVEDLGLEQLNHSYVVNFQTVDVELLEPITLSNTEVRTYEEVRSLVE